MYGISTYIYICREIYHIWILWDSYTIYHMLWCPKKDPLQNTIPILWWFSQPHSVEKPCILQLPHLLQTQKKVLGYGIAAAAKRLHKRSLAKRRNAESLCCLYIGALFFWLELKKPAWLGNQNFLNIAKVTRWVYVSHHLRWFMIFHWNSPYALGVRKFPGYKWSTWVLQ